MKIKLLALVLFCGSALAEGPRGAVEYESEKDNKSGMINQALTVIPGWDFAKGSFISRAELLIERNQDTQADSDGLTAKENKLFLRLRHSGDISKDVGYYIRGGVGRAYNSERSFNYAYIEPGVKYKLNSDWTWVASYREINAIDGLTGQHVGKFMTGPSYDIDHHNEFEIRYVKGDGDKDVTAWLAEYVHKF
jgi:hypothetical protein